MSPLRLSGPTTWADFWVIVGTVVGVLVVVVPFFAKRVWPWWHKRRSRREAEHIAIVGRPAILDPMTGKELSPAQPGIAQWMPATNEKIDKLADAVSKLAEAHVRLDDHEQRITELERARAERVVSQAESAHMWRAIADQTYEGETE